MYPNQFMPCQSKSVFFLFIIHGLQAGRVLGVGSLAAVLRYLNLEESLMFAKCRTSLDF